MNNKQAGAVWRELRGLDFNAVARHMEKGELRGEHVVEIDPRPPLTTNSIAALLEVATVRGLELSYGKTTRRVLVLS